MNAKPRNLLNQEKGARMNEVKSIEETVSNIEGAHAQVDASLVRLAALIDEMCEIERILEEKYKEAANVCL
jgi:hypothetical protein